MAGDPVDMLGRIIALRNRQPVVPTPFTAEHRKVDLGGGIAVETENKLPRCGQRQMLAAIQQLLPLGQLTAQQAALLSPAPQFQRLQPQGTQ